MEFPRVSSRVCVPTGALQIRRLDGADLEPEREQHERLHAAGAAALHPRGRAGRAQQQGRHIPRLERKCHCHSPQGSQEILLAAPHAQVLSDSSRVLSGST